MQGRVKVKLAVKLGGTHPSQVWECFHLNSGIRGVTGALLPPPRPLCRQSGSDSLYRGCAERPGRGQGPLLGTVSGFAKMLTSDVTVSILHPRELSLDRRRGRIRDICDRVWRRTEEQKTF